MHPDSPQHLLIDADDTLWENHAHFIEVTERFVRTMDGYGHERESALEALMTVERSRTKVRGYGSVNFARSLTETAEVLLGREEASRLEERFFAWGRFILEHPITPFPRVHETLETLGKRHEVILVTKGDIEEQRAKVARSGLSGFFRHVEILREKSAEAYHDLAERHRLPPGRSWMVGNSPRSDINPAMAAGLRTVFIPHRTIWELEDEHFDREPDLRLRRFRELTEHF